MKIVSGIRTTGALHLGHLHGVLKNWVKLQHEYECYFFAADLHALTTEYESAKPLYQVAFDMVVDWLALGLNPGSCHIFIQSHVPEGLELHTLLSMITPLSWLERVPTYKDQQLKLKEKDLATYGFLGYPLLQTADILSYKPDRVPVGEDQMAHVEFAREVARRFNHLYGKEPDFEARAEAAIQKMGKKNAQLFKRLSKAYQQDGDQTALERAKALIESQMNLSKGDSERLSGYVEGAGKIILPEPLGLTTQVSKMPGLDGQKMSKSYGNVIGLTEAPESIELKIKRMPTDPARVKRTDPGTPEKCPVWAFHQIYSDAAQQEWVQHGCRSAGIGCLECKQPVIEAIQAETQPIREKAEAIRDNPKQVENILQEGAEAAREVARDTLLEVKRAMGIIE